MADADVQTLRGVAEKLAGAMAACGVRTVGELARYKGDEMPGMSASRLRAFRKQAQAVLRSAACESKRHPDSVIRSHTWRGQAVHFPHGRGLYVGTVGELLVKGPLVGMVVRFKNAAGHTQMCAVSPQTLSALHLLWLQNDVASDDSDDEHERPAARPVWYKLPPLAVDPGETRRFPDGAPQLQALKLTLREVNQVYHLVSDERLLPPSSPEPDSPVRSDPPTPVRSWSGVPSPHPSRGSGGQPAFRSYEL